MIQNGIKHFVFEDTEKASEESPRGRMILYRENATTHIAVRTNEYLNVKTIKIVDHSTYSLDLISNDCFLFS